LGAHCALPDCKRLDFLPIKCSGCQRLYCGQHFSPSVHACPSEAVEDARVPVCPLCDKPIPLRRKGDPPDLLVSAHIDSDCQSDPAKERRRVFDQRCAVKKCKKKEMIRLRCNECGLNFCLTHRHPLDHKCEGKVARRNQAAEAAVARQNRQMSDDEALARALQASLQTSNGSVAAAPKTQEELDRLLALSLAQEDPSSQQQRQRGTRQSGGHGNNCAVS